VKDLEAAKKDPCAEHPGASAPQPPGLKTRRY